MRKDKSIRELEAKLRSELGDSFFDIVDHWDCALDAMGLARPDNHGILIYVSTAKLPKNRYSVILELPSDDNDLPYESAGEFADVDFEELLGIIKRHFNNL